MAGNEIKYIPKSLARFKSNEYFSKIFHELSLSEVEEQKNLFYFILDFSFPKDSLFTLERKIKEIPFSISKLSLSVIPYQKDSITSSILEGRALNISSSLSSKINTTKLINRFIELQSKIFEDFKRDKEKSRKNIYLLLIEEELNQEEALKKLSRFPNFEEILRNFEELFIPYILNKSIIFLVFSSLEDYIPKELEDNFVFRALRLRALRELEFTSKETSTEKREEFNLRDEEFPNLNNTFSLKLDRTLYGKRDFYTLEKILKEDPNLLGLFPGYGSSAGVIIEKIKEDIENFLKKAGIKDINTLIELKNYYWSEIFLIYVYYSLEFSISILKLFEEIFENCSHLFLISFNSRLSKEPSYIDFLERTLGGRRNIFYAIFRSLTTNISDSKNLVGEVYLKNLKSDLEKYKKEIISVLKERTSSKKPSKNLNVNDIRTSLQYLIHIIYPLINEASNFFKYLNSNDLGERDLEDFIKKWKSLSSNNKNLDPDNLEKIFSDKTIFDTKSLYQRKGNDEALKKLIEIELSIFRSFTYLKISKKDSYLFYHKYSSYDNFEPSKDLENFFKFLESRIENFILVFNILFKFLSNLDSKISEGSLSEINISKFFEFKNKKISELKERHSKNIISSLKSFIENEIKKEKEEIIETQYFKDIEIFLKYLYRSLYNSIEYYNISVEEILENINFSDENSIKNAIKNFYFYFIHKISHGLNTDFAEETIVSIIKNFVLRFLEDRISLYEEEYEEKNLGKISFFLDFLETIPLLPIETFEKYFQNLFSSYFYNSVLEILSYQNSESSLKFRKFLEQDKNKALEYISFFSREFFTRNNSSFKYIKSFIQKSIHSILYYFLFHYVPKDRESEHIDLKNTLLNTKVILISEILIKEVAILYSYNFKFYREYKSFLESFFEKIKDPKSFNLEKIEKSITFEDSRVSDEKEKIKDLIRNRTESILGKVGYPFIFLSYNVYSLLGIDDKILNLPEKEYFDNIKKYFPILIGNNLFLRIKTFTSRIVKVFNFLSEKEGYKDFITKEIIPYVKHDENIKYLEAKINIGYTRNKNFDRRFLTVKDPKTGEIIRIELNEIFLDKKLDNDIYKINLEKLFSTLTHLLKFEGLLQDKEFLENLKYSLMIESHLKKINGKTVKIFLKPDPDFEESADIIIIPERNYVKSLLSKTAIDLIEDFDPLPSGKTRKVKKPNLTNLLLSLYLDGTLNKKLITLYSKNSFASLEFFLDPKNSPNKITESEKSFSPDLLNSRIGYSIFTKVLLKFLLDPKMANFLLLLKRIEGRRTKRKKSTSEEESPSILRVLDSFFNLDETNIQNFDSFFRVYRDLALKKKIPVSVEIRKNYHVVYLLPTTIYMFYFMTYMAYIIENKDTLLLKSFYEVLDHIFLVPVSEIVESLKSSSKDLISMYKFLDEKYKDEFKVVMDKIEKIMKKTQINTFIANFNLKAKLYGIFGKEDVDSTAINYVGTGDKSGSESEKMDKLNIQSVLDYYKQLRNFNTDNLSDILPTINNGLIYPRDFSVTSFFQVLLQISGGQNIKPILNRQDLDKIAEIMIPQYIQKIPEVDKVFSELINYIELLEDWSVPTIIKLFALVTGYILRTEIEENNLLDLYYIYLVSKQSEKFIPSSYKKDSDKPFFEIAFSSLFPEPVAKERLKLHLETFINKDLSHTEMNEISMFKISGTGTSFISRVFFRKFPAAITVPSPNGSFRIKNIYIEKITSSKEPKSLEFIIYSSAGKNKEKLNPQIFSKEIELPDDPNFSMFSSSISNIIEWAANWIYNLSDLKISNIEKNPISPELIPKIIAVASIIGSLIKVKAIEPNTLVLSLEPQELGGEQEKSFGYLLERSKF